jgi:predicted dehydrogenase
VRAHYPNARTCFGVDEALTAPGIDAVVIATPIAHHGHLVRRALDAGKHVFVEKPLALTTAECQSLVEAARAANRRLFVGHTFLFNPALDELSRLTVADPVHQLTLSWLKLGTFSEDLLWNLVSHDTAICLRIMGDDPESTIALETRGGATRTDFLAARLVFSGGRSAYIAIDRCAPVTQKVLTAVTASGAVLTWNGKALARLNGGQELEEIFASDAQPLQIEVETFIHSVETGEPTISDGEFGLRVVNVLQQLGQPA